jgi:PBSX family phage terminase large subunit
VPAADPKSLRRYKMHKHAMLHKRRRPYEPLGAAKELFYCQSTEVLIEGPAGTGKSRAVLEKMHLCANKYAGMRGLIVRKTRASCTQSILSLFEQHVVEENSPILKGASRETRTHYTYPNGSELVVCGMDNPDRIMSAEYDMAAVFEATELTEDEYERIRTRLRGHAMPYQQIIADCNPRGPGHWLNRRALAGKSVRMCSRHADNPSCTESYLATLASLTGVLRERFYLGKWVAAEGTVYPSFDRRLHVVPAFEIPKTWRRFRAVDFGFTNPFVCQWWACDPDGRLYLYRELYRTRTLVEDHARYIVQLTGQEVIESTVADHDAEDAATLARHGVETVPAVKDISLGLQAVADRLRPAGDGKPRLFFFDGALVDRDAELDTSRRPCCTVEEFETYVWPQSKEGRSEKEVPVKEHDHGMDAMRYMVRYVDGGTGFGVSCVAHARARDDFDRW